MTTSCTYSYFTYVSTAKLSIAIRFDHCYLISKLIYTSRYIETANPCRITSIDTFFFFFNNFLTRVKNL